MLASVTRISTAPGSRVGSGSSWIWNGLPGPKKTAALPVAAMRGRPPHGGNRCSGLMLARAPAAFKRDRVCDGGRYGAMLAAAGRPRPAAGRDARGIRRAASSAERAGPLQDPPSLDPVREAGPGGGRRARPRRRALARARAALALVRGAGP